MENTKKNQEHAIFFIAKCLGFSLLILAIVTMQPTVPFLGLLGMFAGTFEILRGNTYYLENPTFIWSVIIGFIAVILCFAAAFRFRKRWLSYPLMITGFLIWMFIGIMGLGPA